MLNLTNFSDLQIGGETCDRTGLDNFFSTHPIFEARNFTCTPNWARQKTGAQKQGV